MKTKEAIDWVEQYRYAINSKTDGVIELLERGEKLESIVNHNKIRNKVLEARIKGLKKEVNQ